MKRIAIICHDRAVSGANFSLLDYLEIYDRNKYQILVVLPHLGTELCSKLEALNVNFAVLNLFSVTKPIGKVNIKIRLKKILQRIINSLKYSFKIKNMEKILRDFNPDLIISNSFATLYGALFAQKLNVKHVFHIREYMELDHQTTHYNPKTVEQYCRNSYAVYISNSIKDYYESKYHFIDSCVLYDRVSQDKTFIRERHFYDDKIVKMLIAGSLIPNKGQIDAIKATKILADEGYKVDLYICGKGTDENKLKNYVRVNGIKGIHFLGFINNLNDLRKNIDISLLCSKNEALGRVTVESMYSHSLTIGTCSGETKYLLDGGRGLFYHFGDSNELAAKIIWAIENIDQVEMITDRAYSYAVENFNKDILDSIVRWVE